MDKVLLVYAISQLITTAYGLAVIESVRPIINKKLHDKGYKRNRNSLYNFNSTITDVLKGFIPFYYFSKAISLISNKDNLDKKVDEEIKTGKYVSIDETPEIQIIPEDIKSEDFDFKSEIVFEKPEKYTARKNDYTLYDTYETPIEYITRESTKEDNLELTPFVGENKVVEHVVLKEEVTKKDIAKAITELNPNELEMLAERTRTLANMKRQNLSRKLEKDVA